MAMAMDLVSVKVHRKTELDQARDSPGRLGSVHRQQLAQLRFQQDESSPSMAMTFLLDK